MRVLIAGGEEVGRALAAELVRQGHEAVGLCRESAEAWVSVGAEGVVADWGSPSFQAPGGTFDALAVLAGVKPFPQPESPPAIGDALERLVAALGEGLPQRLVFVSGCDVYGQRDGSVVKESSPTEPLSAWGKALVAAERRLAATVRRGPPWVTLRMAEIYGPERLEWLDRFVRNDVRIPGQGQRAMNMIHLDDAVAAMVAALRSGRAGEIYNGADAEPVTQVRFFTWLAETLGKWMPPFSPETDGGQPNCRVSSRRLTMELGVRLKYPNFREGYTAEIKRLTDAGLLEIKPEER